MTEISRAAEPVADHAEETLPTAAHAHASPPVVLQLNLPEVHAEVAQAFGRYEDALVHNRLDVLDELFCDSALTTRFGIAENLYGIEEIRAFRNARPAAGLARTLHRTVITTYGHDFATAMTEFLREGASKRGRQSQAWVRFPVGWRIVAAHVSLIDPPAPPTPQDPLQAG